MRTHTVLFWWIRDVVGGSGVGERGTGTDGAGRGGGGVGRRSTGVREVSQGNLTDSLRVVLGDCIVNNN